MTPRGIDRRTFLALGVGAVAWACARGTDEAAELGPEVPAPARDISIIAMAVQGLAVGDSRQGFAILRGQRPIAPDDVRVRLVPPGGEPFAVEVAREEVLRGPGGDDGHDHEHPPGTEVNDIYILRHDFDAPGIWDMEVRFEGGGGSASFDIAAEVPSPTTGSPALPSESPTTSDPRGVDPICTRTPECSMHEMTIAQAIGAGRPSVVMFATPRFCTSRTCGPVVDFLQQHRDRVGDAASFVHVEIWRDDRDAVNQVPGGFVPAYAEWNFQGTEPWAIFIDAQGIVRDRWLGAMGNDELGRAVDELIAG